MVLEPDLLQNYYREHAISWVKSACCAYRQIKPPANFANYDLVLSTSETSLNNMLLNARLTFPVSQASRLREWIKWCVDCGRARKYRTQGDPITDLMVIDTTDTRRNVNPCNKKPDNILYMLAFQETRNTQKNCSLAGSAPISTWSRK